ncbi:MAG: MFS transporter [Acidimicrobiales bacterium]
MDATTGWQGGAPVGPGGLSPAAAGIVRSLSLAVVLQWAGAGALLPLLPLYVKDHGGSDLVVGAVMAAYFAAAFVSQYGAGRLSDRLGRLPVLVGGLLVYALGSVLFLLPASPAFDVAFRALQGAGAGGSMVAALAAISTSVPISHRGRAAGRLYGAELGGLAVGPVLGSLAGVGAMRWLFLASAVAAVVAIGPVWTAWTRYAPDAPMPESTQIGGPVASAVAESAPVTANESAVFEADAARRAVLGALLAAATVGVTSGVYEACWSLLMTRHGATQWEIGISWTLFALPFALMSRPAGWLADHLDRRWLAVGSLLWSVGFCATYPFLPGFVLLMVLGVWESLGFSIALPACQSLLGQGTAPQRHGHAQGTFAASQTATTALAAACAGVLFGVHPWMPFVSAAGCCLALVGATVVCWRRVPGRLRPAGSHPAPAPAGGS